MRHRFFAWLRCWILVCVGVLPRPASADAPNEISRRLPAVENQFARLRSHGDFLGFRHDNDVAPQADSSPSATHYQGIARSEVKGRPYLFVTRSGTSDRDRGNLMVVRMGSRDSDGERLRSNRLRKGRSVERTEPPELDRVVANLRYSQYHHPGGIQLCGDILVVPLEGRTTDSVSEGKVVFYNVQDPEHPQRLSVTVEDDEKIGVAGLAKLPDGKFLLVTTGGDGRYLQFYRSNKDSFFDEGFEFVKHDKFDGLKVEDGVWIVGNVSHQTLQLLVEWDGSSSFKVYLMGGYNNNALSPFVPGSDLLTLYEVFGWKSGESIRLKQRDQREMNVTSENWPSVLTESGASKTLANANFLAGLCAYVSPTGEFLVYAIEHFNWGPNKSVRFVEFRHEQVYRESNKIFGKQLVLDAPVYVMEDSSVTLDASQSERMGSLRPWVELFDHDNYDGRSVILDWNDRNEDDFDDFRDLDGFGDGIDDGFNDRASSVRWFAPFGWKIRLHDQDNLGTREPTLDLGGVGAQLGIRNLSDKPYEFDNLNGDLTETRVTSAQLIAPDDDWGWTKPMENLTFTWRLLDAQQQPVKESFAKLVPVPRTPWKMNLQTFSKGPDVLFVELLLGPPPLVREVRPIRFLARNRAPILAEVSTEAFHGGLVNLKVFVKDEDTSDAITFHVRWGDGTPEVVHKGLPRSRVFGASHVYRNPDPQAVVTLPYRVEVWVEDQEGASSPIQDRPVRVVWRQNAAPVAGLDTSVRPPSGEVRVPVATLLQNDSDPDGDEFDFAGVRAVLPEGATARVEDGVLIYAPSANAGNVMGEVQYAVRDQYGKTGVGRVLLPVQGGTVQVPWLQLLTIRVPAPGEVEAEFLGIPGQSMELLSAPGLEGPWTLVGRVTAGTDGRFQVKETALEGVRFYRGQSVGN